MDINKKEKIIDAVKTASNIWKNSFNSGDASGCVDQYEKDAVMHAKPFGAYKGHDEIKAFWEKLISDGFEDVEYIEPEIEVVDENSAILKSKWKMNNAKGVIHKELWVLNENGDAKLREDDFEAL